MSDNKKNNNADFIKYLFDDLYKHPITNEYSKFCMNNYLVLNP